jgi:hypothetical protein
MAWADDLSPVRCTFRAMGPLLLRPILSNTLVNTSGPSATFSAMNHAFKAQVLRHVM